FSTVNITDTLAVTNQSTFSTVNITDTLAVSNQSTFSSNVWISDEVREEFPEDSAKLKAKLYIKGDVHIDGQLKATNHPKNSYETLTSLRNQVRDMNTTIQAMDRTIQELSRRLEQLENPPEPSE
ncbi:MAG: hypothetical protein QNJ64_21075, partial [Crocosphaera sp.]|nr:hypothetical protein [Crocosphaera sp.]